MDNEYLRNIVGSPYIEGYFPIKNHCISEAFKQRIGEGTEGYRDSNARAISYYNSCISEIKPILVEFCEGENSISQKLISTGLTPPQKTKVDSIVKLYRLIVPRIFPPEMSKFERGLHTKTITKDRNFSRDTNPLSEPNVIKGIKATPTNEGVFNKRSKFTTIDAKIKEYVDDIKSIYDKFSVKVKQLYPELVNKLISDIFEVNIKNKNMVMILRGIENIIPVLKPVSSVVPPVISPVVPPVQSPVSSSAVKPVQTLEQLSANDFGELLYWVLVNINNTIHKDKLSKDAFAHPYPSYDVAGETDYHLPTSADEPLITDTAWKRIENPYPGTPITVTLTDNDKKKGGYYIAQKYYKEGEPYRWEHLKEKPSPEPTPDVPAETNPTADVPQDNDWTDYAIEEAVEKQDEKPPRGSVVSDEDELDTGDFVHDFWGKFKKFPVSMTMEVRPTLETHGYAIKFPSGNERVMRVFWNWEKHENNIRVQLRDIKTGKSIEDVILRFFDDQINPQSESRKMFGVSTFLEQVNKNLEVLYSKSALEYRTKVNIQVKKLRPALYAVFRRKGIMEKKITPSNPWSMRLLDDWDVNAPNNHNYGGVEIRRGAGTTHQKRYETAKDGDHKTTIKDFYDKLDTTGKWSKDEFKSALYELGFFNVFDTFLNVITKSTVTTPPITPEEPPTNPVTEPEPEPEPEVKSEPVKKKAQDIPNANDAILTLIAGGTKKKNAEEWVQKIVDVHGDKLSIEDYVAKANPSAGLKPSDVPSNKKTESPPKTMKVPSSSSLPPDVTAVPVTVTPSKSTKTRSRSASSKTRDKNKKNENYTHGGLINPFQKANFL